MKGEITWPNGLISQRKSSSICASWKTSSSCSSTVIRTSGLMGSPRMDKVYLTMREHIE